MSEQWATVCATAHRDLPAGGYPWTRDNLTQCAGWLIRERGMHRAISGMARGGDLLWAAGALDAGVQELLAFIPFEGQTERWNARDRAEWERIRRHPRTTVHILGTLPEGVPKAARSVVVNRLLHSRDRAMLAAADAVVAVWEPGRLDGGTHTALLQAVRRGMPGVHLDPAGRRARHRLPGLDELEKFVLIRDACACIATVGTHAAVTAARDELLATVSADLAGTWTVRAHRGREAVTPLDRCERCRSIRSPQPLSV